MLCLNSIVLYWTGCEGSSRHVLKCICSTLNMIYVNWRHQRRWWRTTGCLSIWGWNSTQLSPIATSVMVFRTCKAVQPLNKDIWSVTLSSLLWIHRTMSSLMEQEKMTWWSMDNRVVETQSWTSWVTPAAILQSCWDGMLKEVFKGGNFCDNLYHHLP